MSVWKMRYLREKKIVETFLETFVNKVTSIIPWSKFLTATLIVAYAAKKFCAFLGANPSAALTKACHRKHCASNPTMTNYVQDKLHLH